MGESGALGNTQAYSTHSENPSANQISPSIATDETFGLGDDAEFDNRPYSRAIAMREAPLSVWDNV